MIYFIVFKSVSHRNCRYPDLISLDRSTINRPRILYILAVS